MADVAPADTRTLIMEAARRRLLADGYAGLSTRKVADDAPVPLSQLHYHFGSKQGLILQLLEDENQRRLDRQSSMYAEDAPLWKRYERACDYLEDDLESGYVRVLHEMIAAGWSNAEIQASRPRPARGLVRPSHPGGPRRGEPLRPTRSVHRRGGRAPCWAPPSSAPRHCCCWVSTGT